MDQIIMALRDLKQYIDVQPNGAMMYLGRPVRELEGYKQASRLLQLLEDRSEGLNVSVGPSVVGIETVAVGAIKSEHGSEIPL